MIKKVSGAKLKTVLIAVAFVVVCFAAPAAGQLFGGPGQWYRELNKPSFTPPGWLFGPVWTLLYICMGLAAWLIWRKIGFRRGVLPLSLFALQLILNAVWTPLFFGLQSPLLAFVDIVALWMALTLTTICFFRVSRTAGWLLVPYLAWSTFAAVLNFTICRMNL